MEKIWDYAFIYIIKFPNEKKYIGRWTSNFNRLLIRYSKIHNENRFVERAIKKYGFENIKIDILEEFNNISNFDLNKKEIDYIALFDSTNQSKGYNIQSGGRGKPIEVNCREAISKKAKLRLSDKKKHPNYGKKYTEESRNKISKALKNKYCGKDNKNWKGYLDKEELIKLIKNNKTHLEIQLSLSACQKRVEDSLFFHFGTKSLTKVKDEIMYPDKDIFEQLIMSNTMRSLCKIGYHQSYLQKCLLYHYGTTSLPEVKNILNLKKCNWCKFNEFSFNKLKSSTKLDGLDILSDYNLNLKRESLVSVVCKNNHKFKIRVRSLERGTRCNRCLKDSIFKKNVDKLVSQMKLKEYKLVEVIRNSYKSKTRIIYDCSKGHTNSVLWKQWENSQVCAICKKENHKNIRDKI